MSDDSDYDVEQYVKPTVKRSTYNNGDDKYLSEEGDSSLSNNEEDHEEEQEKSDGSENEEKDNKIEEKSIEKKIPERTESKPKAVKKDKIVAEEPVRTNNRFILHVSNLPIDTSKNMLETFFFAAGQIKGIRQPKNRKFAFVEMTDITGFNVSVEYVINIIKLKFYFSERT
jgi:hypothetical protein